MNATTKTLTIETPKIRTDRLAAVLGAFLLGTFLFYGVGFAQPMKIHNAAHDSRHSFSFPCH